jgi:cysteine-rich repeat protein
LTAGYHQIVVTMFEAGGDQALYVSWQGPSTGGAKTAIGAGSLFVEVPVVVTNEPPVLDSVADQVSRQGDTVALPLSATDSEDDALYFDATGLPSGLVLDHETGEITGSISAPGTSTVTASASDGPEVSVVTFQWTVAAPFCGDGTLDDGEQCDDGNMLDGDGCSSLCETESPLPDGGLPDAGLPDGGVPDAGVPDGSVPDAGLPDGGTQSGGGGGCSVSRGRAPLDSSSAWWCAALAFWFVRRRASRLGER